MKNDKAKNKYWENEEGELIEIGGNKFIRCFDKAGKLQIGNVFFDRNMGVDVYAVKITIDRKQLLDSKEGLSYLKQLLEDWESEAYDD